MVIIRNRNASTFAVVIYFQKNYMDFQFIIYERANGFTFSELRAQKLNILHSKQ